MDKYYLTENIFLTEKEMFCEKNNKIKKINTRDWHLSLYEYGWNKLPLQWIKKINNLSNQKNKNSRYAIYNCKTDGNCFFQCIANSFNERDRFKGEEYNSEDIRNMIADSITLEDYENVISYYKIMKDADDFDEEWNPYDIQTLEDFKRQIREPGNNYWGDWLLLTILTKTLQLNIFILNSSVEEKDYTIYNTCINYNQNYDSIFLLFENGDHFQLIGYFDDNQMISYFKVIPHELKRLFQIHD